MNVQLSVEKAIASRTVEIIAEMVARDKVTALQAMFEDEHLKTLVRNYKKKNTTLTEEQLLQKMKK